MRRLNDHQFDRFMYIHWNNISAFSQHQVLKIDMFWVQTGVETTQSQWHPQCKFLGNVLKYKSLLRG